MLGTKGQHVPHGAALTAALGRASWQKSLATLQQAKLAGVEVNIVHLGATMASFGKAAKWEVAVALLSSIPLFEVPPNILVLNSLMMALDKARQWEVALSCFDEMSAACLQADVITLNSLVSCCSRAEAWQEALSIFDSFENWQVQRDRISFNSAMYACERVSCIQPDVISFNTVLGALEASGHWPLSLSLLQERSKCWPADPVAVGVVVACCEASRAVSAAVRLARAHAVQVPTPNAIALPECRGEVQADDASDGSFEHTSVLLEEVTEAFVAAQLPRGAVVVDCTLGGAGHSQALLEALPHVRLFGIDRDSLALQAAARRLAPLAHDDRLKLVQGNFADFPRLLQESGERPLCHGLLADLGVSSPQLDRFDRGFSFRGDGPLDMRMDTEDTKARTAAWYIRNLQPKQLANYIRDFGEEAPEFAELVAEELCAAKPARTREAVKIIEECARQACLPAGRVHVATRTFQALRILVNGELQALESLLLAAEKNLAPGGLLAIITFHSLEDDMVRRKVRGSALARGSREDSLWIPAGSREGLRPSDAELHNNARSRSARLRLAVRAGRTATSPGEKDDTLAVNQQRLASMNVQRLEHDPLTVMT
ncbi:unnamed protein product [Durusdinium trenchii]|uniref:Ribosomal RNA small subunit methyltransferase H n=1 Tax=Durusdinium trenchii TaxID=1381693 RepID=A0ABP0LG65_9DINO